MTAVEQGWSELAVPDVGLTDRHLEAARAVLARMLPGGLEPRLSFVSGSLAAGLGHAASDLDVYVLPPAEAPAFTLGTYPQDGLAVQVNLLTPESAAEAIRASSTFDMDHRNRWQVDLGEDSLIRAIRLGIGTILHQSMPGVAPDPVRRSIMRKVLISWHSRDLSSDAEDVYGARGIGDLLTGLWASGLALRQGIECLLAGADDLYYGPKFLLRRLARNAATAPLMPDIWELLRDPSGVPDEAAGWVLCERRLRVASALAAIASLDGWDEPLRTPPTLPDESPHGLRRSPWFVPIRFGAEWALTGPDKGLRTSEDITRFWLALDGPAATLPGRLKSASDKFGNASEEQIAATVRRLAEVGAAHIDSD